MDAECYQKTAEDRAIILNVRAFYKQPFVAPGWKDLRLGFFLSLTDEVNDDLTTGLAETIVNPGVLSFFDRYWLGVIDNATGATFAGFTNVGAHFPDPQGDSTLVASDAGVGAGTAFWRPGNSSNNKYSAAIVDTKQKRSAILDNLQQHFPQDSGTVAAGYAVLLGLQLTRFSTTSRTLNMRIKSTTKSADMLYSNTPTKELIQQSMESWPVSAQMGPVTVSHVPDTFYFYWPFRNSRLRVHSLGFLRAG
jgi:hypothetical protein